MKYNQPFDQPSNPNASFVDGNPGTGVAGSIPPAASLEFPQRELVNAIAAAGLTPDNGDLFQLLRTVRGGQLTTVTDTGAVNALVIAATGTAHTAIMKGLPFRIFPANTNTSATVTLKVDAIAAAPVVKRDGTAPGIGDIVAGTPIDVVADGLGKFRMLATVPSDILTSILANGNIVTVTDTGTANALAGVGSPAITAYRTGQVYLVTKGAAGSTATAPTLNVSSLGAKPITNRAAGALASGDLPASANFLFVDDGTEFRVLGMVNSDVAAISPPAAGSILTSGWWRDANTGFTIQWGKITAVNGTGAITFPRAFTTLFAAVATDNGATTWSTTNASFLGVGSPTATGFTAQTLTLAGTTFTRTGTNVVSGWLATGIS